ncbi:TapY2 family type IVa secretion system protein [Thalassotalea sp. 1_MG-2023]|uniref:TapY2 family type IVa secretion system protein n=1 Tax=Thalassotalea sp. 1_MG-2023 TaxID=3062680 RepID=UPI0026E456C3|nr:TapY2 family type IVa secretion system protein [Thalassotalea sp. 1_MG-2023]MDO6427818.1 TapY2 family type IVa secretion system protein [Thalassotalea sp. 1_MG-2023]
MKKTLCLYTALIVSSSALAQEGTNLVSDKILAKCYVEVLGGQRTIHKVTIKEEQLSSLADRLSGRNIRVSGKQGFSTVHKVFECLPNDDAFKAGRARHLEKSQVK